ncbi:uncharacterized protein F5891DRAFT_1184309 [Suillus fuscotomentosus]|uniref:Uncharacterized protein n=1 Tax=Suillus fuscotomentosus TaxID=1912939 RepID=A0AAD4HQB3_9AGAM|nr:uncharacterized protein F5891DRAFT_1184309 [Suillus fuscotomentosus]KAG1904887.1 hypothetical protein F5891DRAFT_1184309 [Suillus fuscotomentosus]
MTPEPSDISGTSTHFQDLLNNLNSGVRGGRRRKFCGPIEPYLHAARWFPLTIDPFAVLEDVLYEGMEAEFSELRADTSDEEASSSNNHQKELCIKQYKELVKLVPTFSDIISGFEKVPSALDNFIHALTCAANDARSDDTGSLMREGLVYMLKNPETDQFNPPLLKQHGKIVRGWNHPQTARLLCPMRMLDVFDKNPQDFMDKVKEGKIEVVFEDTTSNVYACLSYPCSSNTILPFEQVFRHIFTGPSSAISATAHKGTKAPKGRIHGMTSPLPRAIAYAAVQAYFQLSSATQWRQQIGDFDLVLLYDRVVNMFEGNSINKQWVQETLDHWKSETPGLLQRGRSKARIDAGLHVFDSEDDMDDFFESDGHSPDNGEQGPQDRIESSGNAENTHGI